MPAATPTTARAAAPAHRSQGKAAFGKEALSVTLIEFAGSPAPAACTLATPGANPPMKTVSPFRTSVPAGRKITVAFGAVAAVMPARATVKPPRFWLLKIGLPLLNPTTEPSPPATAFHATESVALCSASPLSWRPPG